MSVVQTSVGPTLTGLGANNTTVGAVAWTNPNNVTLDDGTRATASLTSQQSNYLKATRFPSLNIPTNATIDGIIFTIEKSRTAGTGTLSDTSVRLVKHGGITGINHSSQGAAWTGSDAVSTYGDSADLWGCVLTPGDVNDPDFGVVFSCSETAAAAATAGLDYVKITVYYTPGYDSAPQVQSTSEIILGGHSYHLAAEPASGGNGTSGKVRETLATTFPPKITNGDYGRDSNPVVSSWGFEDTSGGIGRLRYTQDVSHEQNQIWTSLTTGAGTWHPHAATLPPLVTDLGNPSGVTSPMDSCVDFLGVVMATFLGDTRSLSSDTWSSSLDTLPGAVLGTAIFNSRLFYALGAFGYSYRTATTGAATDAADAPFVSFVTWDSKLYGLALGGTLYSSTTGLTASWTTLATLPYPDGSGNIQNELAITYTAAGDSYIMVQTIYGGLAYDAVNDKWFPSSLHNIVGAQIRGGRSANRGHVGYALNYNGSLFTINGRRITKQENGSGAVELVGLDRRDGTENVHKGWPVSMVTDGNLLFMGIQNSYQIGVGSEPMVCLWNEKGWHIVWQGDSGAASDIPCVNAIAFSYAIALTPRLYIAATDVSNVNHVYALDLVDIMTTPSQSTTRKYASTGAMEYPYVDYGVPERIKTGQQVRVKLINASTTNYAQLAYRDGDTSSYTSLGDPITASSEVSVPFGTGNVGFPFRQLQLRATFTRGTTNTVAPIIDYLILDAVQAPEILRSFHVKIDLTGNSPDNRTPSQQYDDLYSALKSGLFMTFAYRDDSGNVRSWVVKPFAPDVAIETGYEYRGGFALTLVEMAPNG